MEFEWVEKLKYLWVELNVSGHNHKEILNRINSTNKCFYGLKTILKSNVVSIRSKFHFIQSNDTFDTAICV